VPCQALLALLVLVASMVISRQLPFRYARNNVLQFYSSVISFLTLFFGMFFYTDRLTTSLENIIVAMCVSGWVLVLGFNLHGIAHEYLSYFAHQMVQRNPWMESLFLHPACVWLFNTKAALNPFVHWAWRDILIDDIFWTSVENPKAIRQLLPSFQTEEEKSLKNIDAGLGDGYVGADATGGWMDERDSASPSDQSPVESMRNGSAHSSMLDLVGLSPVSKARAKTRRATVMLVEQAVHNKSVLDAMAVHGLDAMSKEQLDLFHDFLGAPGVGNPKVYDEWAELMKSTGKPAALADCIKSILEFKHMNELKIRLDRYKAEKAEKANHGIQTIVVEAAKGGAKGGDTQADVDVEKGDKRAPAPPTVKLHRPDYADDDSTA
jgi:hypothetical protein